MSNKGTKTFAIRLDKEGTFDTLMINHARALIRSLYEQTRQSVGRKPTYTEVAYVLGRDRWRVARLVEALEITDLF